MYSFIRTKKKVKQTLSIWRPSVSKYIKIFIREYGIPREEALLKYTWSDIQDFVTALPIEKVITVYPSKEADNKGRYLMALCDKDIDMSKSQTELGMQELERRQKIRQEKLKKINP